MLETESIHLVACRDSIAVVRKADKSKALGHAGFPVLGKEDSGDTTEALEHVAQFSFFRHLGDLFEKKYVLARLQMSEYMPEKVIQLTLVTRSVAKSSLSPNFDPMRSPAPLAPRRAGGTYEPFFPAPAAPTEAATSSTGGASPPLVSPTGAIVSL